MCFRRHRELNVRSCDKAHPIAIPSSHLPEHLLKEFPILFHMLFDVREEVFGSGLPIFCLVAYPAGEEDEFIGVGRRDDEVFGVAAHHAQAIDEHADEEIGFAQVLAGGAGDEPYVDQGG
jgi:hypothetical protein